LALLRVARKITHSHRTLTLCLLAGTTAHSKRRKTLSEFARSITNRHGSIALSIFSRIAAYSQGTKALPT
jgi:hypothetical protein